MFNRYKRLEPEIIEELKNRYLAGEKCEVIKIEMGVSSKTILKYVYELGLPRRQPWQSKRVRKHDTRSKSQESNQQTAEQV